MKNASKGLHVTYESPNKMHGGYTCPHVHTATRRAPHPLTKQRSQVTSSYATKSRHTKANQLSNYSNLSASLLCLNPYQPTLVTSAIGRGAVSRLLRLSTKLYKKNCIIYTRILCNYLAYQIHSITPQQTENAKQATYPPK